MLVKVKMLFTDWCLYTAGWQENHMDFKNQLQQYSNVLPLWPGRKQKSRQLTQKDSTPSTIQVLTTIKH